MARRTKQESERTRQRIVEAAREEFERRGFAHTTLERVAATAGVTRGAVYWHFSDKRSLFNAVRDQVVLPMLDRIDFDEPATAGDDPLSRVERYLFSVIDALEQDDAARCTFAILHFRCEYVDPLADEFDHQLLRHRELLERLASAYERARGLGLTPASLDPRLAAGATLVMLAGLVRVWLLDREGTLVRGTCRGLIAAHVAALRVRNGACPSPP